MLAMPQSGAGASTLDQVAHEREQQQGYRPIGVTDKGEVMDKVVNEF